MKTLTVREVADIVGGELHADPEARVRSVEFDSRKVESDGVFVALRGARADGHDFASSTAASVTLAARSIDAPHIVVPRVDNPHSNAEAFAHDPSGDNASVLAALAALARHNIDSLDVTVVGVTGSAGKTSTKDLIASVLRTAGETIAPPGSFNNEIGHPYTALRCDENTDFLVAELSARGVGHVAHLAQIAPPSVGVVLNVGTAHIGEFGDQHTIAQAKGELVEALPVDGVAILNADDPLVAGMASRTQARVRTFSTTSSDADYYATDISGVQPEFMLHSPKGSIKVTLQVFGTHQVSNALAAAAVGMELGLSAEQVASALEGHTAASAHRMDVRRLEDEITVIDDAYNANPDSMRAGIEALVGLRSTGRTWAVLGQMNELGADAAEQHRKVGEYVSRAGVDTLIAVGDSAQLAALADAATITTHRVAAVEEAVALLRTNLGPGDTVLVKASYSDSLWRVADALAHAAELSHNEE